MCGICGCGEGETRIEAADSRKLNGERHDHAHDHSHQDRGHHHDDGRHHHHHGGDHGHDDGERRDHGHNHSHHEHHGGEHSHDGSELHGHDSGQSRIVKIEQDLLAKNDAYAAENRARFNSAGILALNLVSSPGSGKTSLLADTINRVKGELPVAVIEGDQQTSMDAERIRATGAPAIQINTGKGCHLDAHMTGHAFDHLQPASGSVLFIENVGNLVCPAMFDLGEEHRVVLVSVTEGEDKPLKYPDMIRSSQLMLITKVDLLPHLDFDVDALAANARKINPGIKILKVSSRSGEGMDAWVGFIRAARSLALTGHAAAESKAPTVRPTEHPSPGAWQSQPPPSPARGEGYSNVPSPIAGEGRHTVPSPLAGEGQGEGEDACR